LNSEILKNNGNHSSKYFVALVAEKRRSNSEQMQRLFLLDDLRLSLFDRIRTTLEVFRDVSDAIWASMRTGAKCNTFNGKPQQQILA
jgi:hypothetical protein